VTAREANEPVAEFSWADLCNILRHEVVCLERVLYRATTLRMFTLAANPRHMSWAAQELEDATQETRRLELRRAVVTASLAVRNGMVADAPLSSLGSAAPDPYKQLLADLRTQLVERGDLLSTELLMIRRTAPLGQKAIVDQIELLTGSVMSSDPDTGKPSGYNFGQDPLMSYPSRSL
jgi:hypothetical protein